MGLNFDKHKEHLEKDIRAELQKKFGSGFEIEDISDIVLSSYCPTFLFKINLEDYKEKYDYDPTPDDQDKLRAGPDNYPYSRQGPPPTLNINDFPLEGEGRVGSASIGEPRSRALLARFALGTSRG